MYWLKCSKVGRMDWMESSAQAPNLLSGANNYGQLHAQKLCVLALLGLQGQYFRFASVLFIWFNTAKPVRYNCWLNNMTQSGPEMVWGPHNMPLFSWAPVLLPPPPLPCLDGWFETNWDQLTIGGPQIQLLDRTTFLSHSSSSEDVFSLQSWC